MSAHVKHHVIFVLFTKGLKGNLPRLWTTSRPVPVVTLMRTDTTLVSVCVVPREGEEGQLEAEKSVVSPRVYIICVVWRPELGGGGGRWTVQLVPPSIVDGSWASLRSVVDALLFSPESGCWLLFAQPLGSASVGLVHLPGVVHMFAVPSAVTLFRSSSILCQRWRRR